MFKTIKEYFIFNEERRHLGDGGWWTFIWIFNFTGGKTPWIFILPLVYMAYTGNKLIITLMFLSLFAFTCFSWPYLHNSDLLIDFFVFVPFAVITLCRDMFFLVKYDINAFVEKEDTSNASGKFILGLIIIFFICILVFKLRQ